MKGKNGLTAIIAILSLLLILPVVAGAITVSTDKEVYYPGDTLTVSGLATPNALVSVVVNNPTGALVTIDQVRAGEDGTYSITILTFPTTVSELFPFGTYTITARDTATGEEASVQVQFTSPMATITGTVVDAQGNPVEGATVTVLMEGATVAVDVTDDQGNFEVMVADTGTYTVKVEKEGFVTSEVSVTVNELPSTVTTTIVLNTQRLSVSIEAITRDGKPLFGVAREGEVLEVKVKVYYGNVEVEDATVKGYLTSGPRMAMGLPPIEFELVYDPETGLYTGSVQIPAPGLDRQCMVTVEAAYADETASQTVAFITLVNTVQQVADLEQRVGDLEVQTQQLQETIQVLSDTVSQLSGNLEQLQDNLNNLQTQLTTLQATVQNLQNQLAGLAAKDDVENLRNEVNLLRNDLTNVQNNVNNLQNQLNQLQTNINDLNAKLNDLDGKIGGLESRLANLENQVNQLSDQVKNAAGARGLAQAGLALGIIAILIALGFAFYINKKISA